MAYHDFDWFADRLDPAKVKSDNPGERDWMVRCPVHGGSDSLHLTEKNGKALVNCFGCDADYKAVVEALEAEESDPGPESESAPEALKAPKPRRARSDQETQEEQETPIASTASTDLTPLDWLAEYCAVPRAWLETFPGIAETDDGVWVAHTWDGLDVVKLRKKGSGDRMWHPKNANQPRIWPTLPMSLPPEIWLAEGETDVIALRYDGVEHAYTAGSASQPLTAEEMKYLKHAGVERIVIAYDTDKAGAKATSETLKAAKEAGLGASTAVLGDPLRGGPKDWRERHLQHDVHEPPETNAQLATQEVWNLTEVEPAETTKLLLGKLHPDDHTILFGDGGTGKGVIASWWAARLVVEHEKRVLIVDYEEHARHEWRPRIERFAQYHNLGGEPNPTRKGHPVLENVYIYQPTGPIWDEAGAIFAMCEELDITYIIVDSVTYACLGVEVEKSVTATQYSDAVRQFKRPTLSLAHTTKADADPRHPFGSVFWSNGARITVGVVVTGEGDTRFDSPRKLELKKANQGGDHKPTEILWDWVTGDLPTELVETEVADTRLAAQVLNAIAQGATTISDIVNDIAANNSSKPPPEKQSVSNAVQKLKRAGKVELDGKAWKLIGEDAPIPINKRKRGAP